MTSVISSGRRSRPVRAGGPVALAAAALASWAITAITAAATLGPPTLLATVALCAPVRAQPAPVVVPPGADGNPAGETRIAVQSFRIDGNTLLDGALLQATLMPWLGSRTLAELRQAALAVQALYGQAGYGAVVAYLPPQAPAGAELLIQVVEGRVSRISVQGQRRLTAERVRAALPTLVLGATPRVQRIDAELQIANENPARVVGVLLSPGSAPGEVHANVQVDEQALQRISLALDNSGNSRTGDYRLGLGWQHADATGHDDVLSLQLQVSPTRWQAVQVLSAGYRLPWVRALAALDVFAAYSDVDGGLQASAAGDLRFAGKGHLAGTRITRYLPRWGELDQRLLGGIDYRAYLNDCQVAGLAGACGAAGQSVALQPLTLEYAAQSGGPLPSAFNLVLAHNLALGGRHGSAADFDAVRSGASRHYSLLRAAGQISLPVLDDNTFKGRFAAQHSADRLVPGEQFGLGGASTVRGYGERELAGDTGWLVSVELATPRLDGALALAGIDARLLVFADGGQVANHGTLPCRGQQQRCGLSSLGIGAQLGWRTLHLRLFLAQALQDGAITQRQDWRTHFALSARF